MKDHYPLQQGRTGLQGELYVMLPMRLFNRYCKLFRSEPPKNRQHAVGCALALNKIETVSGPQTTGAPLMSHLQCLAVVLQFDILYFIFVWVF